MNYIEWIEANVPGDGYGKCAEVTRAMVRAFPELERVCGFYHCPAWGRREHWWCEAPGGLVVDPTAAQFPSRGHGRYQKLDPKTERHLVPTGVCMDCGGPVYRGNTFCDETCEERTMAYMGMELDPETGNWRNAPKG